MELRARRGAEAEAEAVAMDTTTPEEVPKLQTLLRDIDSWLNNPEEVIDESEKHVNCRYARLHSSGQHRAGAPALCGIVAEANENHQ